MPPQQFRIYIVRHGETEWNKARRVQGHLDVPLNEVGLVQAMLVAEALKEVPFAKAFSSDLQRASKTAECILQFHPDAVLEQDTKIRERYMGELEGQVVRSSKTAPSMETIPNFTSRCLAWYMNSIVEHMGSVLQASPTAEQPHNILIVSHGAWIAVLLSALRDNGIVSCRKDVRIGHCLNTGVSIIEHAIVPVERHDFLVGTLVQFSDIEHLMSKNLHVQEVNADVLKDRGSNF